MRKMASILETNNPDTAKIMLYKHKKCHGCGACNKHMHPGSIFEASNAVLAKKGDIVSVQVHKKFSLIEFFVAYLLPVAAFFGGILIGSLLFPGERGGAVSVGLAFLLLVLTIAFHLVFKKRYHPNYSASVTKVIQPANPGL